MDKEYLRNIAASPYIEKGSLNRQIAMVNKINTIIEAKQSPEKQKKAKLENTVRTRTTQFIQNLINVLRPFSEGTESISTKLKNMTPEMSMAENKMAGNITLLYRDLKGIVTDPRSYHDLQRAQIKQVTSPTNKSVEKGLAHHDYPLATGYKTGALKEVATHGDIEAAMNTKNPNEIVKAYAWKIKLMYNRFMTTMSGLFPTEPTEFNINRILPILLLSHQKQALIKIHNISKSPLVSAKDAVPATASPEAVKAASTTGVPTKDASVNKSQADDFVGLIVDVLKIINRHVQFVGGNVDRPSDHSKHYFSMKTADGNYYLPTTMEEPLVTVPADRELDPVEPDPTNYKDGDGNPQYIKDKERYDAIIRRGYYKTAGDVGSATGYEYQHPTPVNLAEEASETPASDESGDEKGTGADAGDVHRRRDLASKIQPFEKTDDFVYDFASLYHKHPGHYTIEVTPEGGYTVKLRSGPEKIIRVFWNWDRRENNIVLKIRDAEKSNWSSGIVLKFWDDQVNPRSPSYVSKAMVPYFIDQASKRAIRIYKSASNYEGIEEQEKILKPALYAVIRRKGEMEFKVKTHDKLGLYIAKGAYTKDKDNVDYGKVIVGKTYKGTQKNTELTWRDLIAKYHSGSPDEKAAWREAIENLDYFTNFPDLSDKFNDVESKKRDVIAALSTRYSKNTAESIKGSAEEIFNELKSDIVNMSVNAIVDKVATKIDNAAEKEATKLNPPTVTVTPPATSPDKPTAVVWPITWPKAAKDAAQELFMNGVDSDEIKIAISYIVSTIDSDQEFTQTEYVNMATQKLSRKKIKNENYINPFQKANFIF